MNRTTLLLPPELRRQAAAEAARRGISLGELIRQSLVRETAVAYQVASDPFWSDAATFAGGPSDLAARHDDELYGPISAP